MGSLSFWFLKLALKCINHLAWPVLALGYPLYASVQAIETDSYPETRDLISYWILLSLIYLFEYTFLKLLQWLLFWPYIKLMIICWVIIPDFGKASYVYNHLIHSCMYVKPQAIISRLKNWKMLSFQKEDFLLQAERYIRENGTEGLEKLIACKNTTHNPDAEAINAIRVTEKIEMQQTDWKKLHKEDKDIKDLEVVEKKEVPAGKQDDSSNQSTSSTMVETKAMVEKDSAVQELPQSSAHKKVQKEWTCAICQVTTHSETTLNLHLFGRKHRAKCEALKAKYQQEKSTLNDAVQQRTIEDQENTSMGDQKGVHAPANKSDTLNAGTKNEVVIDHEKSQELQNNLGKHLEMNPSKLRCEICNVSCNTEANMASHLNGRKHLARIRILSEAYIQ